VESRKEHEGQPDAGGLLCGEDRLLTVPEVAKLMGLAVGTIYHLISQKRIPVVRLSARCVRVRLSHLLVCWDEMTEMPKPRTIDG
jgi:excisionase family DNA binding protein